MAKIGWLHYWKIIFFVDLSSTVHRNPGKANADDKDSPSIISGGPLAASNISRLTVISHTQVHV